MHPGKRLAAASVATCAAVFGALLHAALARGGETVSADDITVALFGLSDESRELRARAEALVGEFGKGEAFGKIVGHKKRYVETILEASALSASIPELEAKRDYDAAAEKEKRLGEAIRSLVELKAGIAREAKAARSLAELAELRGKLDLVWRRSEGARRELRAWHRLAGSVREMDSRLGRLAGESRALRERLAAFEASAKEGAPGGDDPASADLAGRLALVKEMIGSADESARRAGSVREKRCAELRRIMGLPAGSDPPAGGEEKDALRSLLETYDELRGLSGGLWGDRSWADHTFRSLAGALHRPRVLEMDGEYRLKREGRPFKVLCWPVELETGDVVATGPDAGVAVEFEDGSVVTLGPSSTLVLPKGSKAWRRLEAGSAGIAPAAPVATATPLAKIAPRGASEHVVIVSEKATRVMVRSGEVEISAVKGGGTPPAGGKLVVKGGESAAILPGAFPDTADALGEDEWRAASLALWGGLPK